MLVVESGNREVRGKYRLPITKQVEMIINDLLRRQPVIEIEVKSGDVVPVKHRIKAAKIRNKLLEQAKKRSLVAKAHIKKLESKTVTPEERKRLVMRLKQLEKELKKLKALIDKYDKICSSKVVFIRGDILKKAVPDKEAASIIMSPDVMQFLLYFLTS